MLSRTALVRFWCNARSARGQQHFGGYSCANRWCWKTLEIDGITWPGGRSSVFNVSPRERECGAFPLAWAWPKKPQEPGCNGDSRHLCRHAAGQVTRRLSPVSPLSPAGRMCLPTPISSPNTQVSASLGFCLGGDVAYRAQSSINIRRFSKRSPRR